MPSGGGGNSGGGGTTVQKTEPWDQAKPYLEDALKQAQRLYQSDTGKQYYSGSTVVPFSGETNQALYRQTQRATRGSPLIATGKNELASTIRGDYLDTQPGMAEQLRIGQGSYLNSDPARTYLDRIASGAEVNGNPYADAMFKRQSDQLMKGVSAQFAGKGRYGSGAHQNLLQEGLGNLATDFYGGIYETERNRQMAAADKISDAYGRERQLQQSALQDVGQQFQAERGRQAQALQLAPTYSAQDYADIDRLAAVGQQREQLAQDKLAADIDRFNFYQQNPYNRLAEYSAILQGYGQLGSTGTSVAPSLKRNRLAGGLGGAAGGAAIGTMIAPGIGTAIGAGLGGLAGAFS